MFKFGRPNKLYDENLVHDFVQQHFVTGATYASGMTMNFMISVDPAIPSDFAVSENIASRYGTKIVNPNFYGTITERIRWDDEL